MLRRTWVNHQLVLYRSIYQRVMQKVCIREWCRTVRRELTITSYRRNRFVWKEKKRYTAGREVTNRIVEGSSCRRIIPRRRRRYWGNADVTPQKSSGQITNQVKEDEVREFTILIIIFYYYVDNFYDSGTHIVPRKQ